MSKTFLLSIAAFAVLHSVAPAASVQASDESEERMVCKYQMQTGTRFKTKVCKTAAQWEEMAEAHRKGLTDLVNRPQIKVCGPSGCD